MHVNLFKLSFGCFFAWPLETIKSGQVTAILHVYLLFYQSLYDLANPIGHNLISILVLTNAFGDIISWSYQSFWLQTDVSPCSYQSS